MVAVTGGVNFLTLDVFCGVLGNKRFPLDPVLKENFGFFSACWCPGGLFYVFWVLGRVACFWFIVVAWSWYFALSSREVAAVGLASSHNSSQPWGVWKWGLPVRIHYYCKPYNYVFSLSFAPPTNIHFSLSSICSTSRTALRLLLSILPTTFNCLPQ